MIRTIIVDDEPLALDVLETYIEQVPELELVARCANALEANKVLAEEEIDLMFLDIQMPQLTGIDFLKSLVRPPLVVFTTAYPNYAIEGFELDALDYLLKPISMERFLKAVNRASEMLKLRQADEHPATEQTADDELQTEDDFIFVKSDKKLVRVNYDDVLYIEGLKDYVIIRMEKGRVITLQTMKSLEDKLPRQRFQRIHRSYIVNLDKIQAIIGNMVEVMEKGQVKHLPVGKNYREELLQIINSKRL
ncbi:MAG: DNA-binding response regulator [Bacteroidetes bacterium]|nr:MAG: DNA-binding response regulator [Bacteroidota bacterium]